jgi:hypothetical protein
MKIIKRKFLIGIAASSVIIGCKDQGASKSARVGNANELFQGVGWILVVDAVADSEMLGVEFFAENETYPFYASSVTRKGNRAILSFGRKSIPLTVRVNWRQNDESFWSEGRIRYSGKMQGDYTIPIASRIPRDVIESIKVKGGGLRLKFRLKPDGVLFGWDIARSVPIPGETEYKASVFEMAGGDFLDTKY